VLNRETAVAHCVAVVIKTEIVLNRTNKEIVFFEKFTGESPQLQGAQLRLLER
jgi:hypothetical protein